MSALLVGAVLGCTSSTIVLPVLQQVEARAPVRIALSSESALGDVFAVLAVGVLLSLDTSNGPLLHNVARTLLGQITVAVLLGVLDSLIWSRLLPMLSEQRFWHTLTLANVLLLYACAEYLHAGSLIAVLSFGLTLANFQEFLHAWTNPAFQKRTPGITINTCSHFTRNLDSWYERFSLYY